MYRVFNLNMAGLYFVELMGTCWNIRTLFLGRLEHVVKVQADAQNQNENMKYV